MINLRKFNGLGNKLSFNKVVRPFTDKMRGEKIDNYFKFEKDFKEKNKEYLTKYEQRMKGLFGSISLLRLPVLISLGGLIWMSPFHPWYNATVMFNNQYLILLTIFEGAGFCSTAFNRLSVKFLQSNASNKERIFHIFIAKRLNVMALFFYVLLGSSFLASNYEKFYSLLLPLISNFYLMLKMSLQIARGALGKYAFEKRVKYIQSNLLLLLFLSLIIYSKDKFIKNNLN